MNFHKFMCGYVAKIIKNTTDLFIQQFSMNLDEVLRKISIVEYSN
jgi:hypothetical protein